MLVELLSLQGDALLRIFFYPDTHSTDYRKRRWEPACSVFRGFGGSGNIVYEYVGHMHIHSTHSDGEGTIPEITMAARQAPLDFLIITDHNTLSGKLAGEEGFREGVLVLIDLELEVPKKGYHCLALGLEDVPPESSTPEELLASIQERGGFCFLAHPCELGSPILHHGRALCWQEFPASGFAGLEIWNYSSRWRDSVRTVSEGFLRYYLHRPGLALSPCPLTVGKWDELSMHRPVVAVGGSDAHAVHLKVGPFRPVLFPYLFLFRGVNMHIFLRQPLGDTLPKAKEQVYDALRQGNSFVALDHPADSRGFRCTYHCKEEEYLPGESVPAVPGSRIRVRSPRPSCLIKVLRNGVEVCRGRGPDLDFTVVREGVYRVEVHLKPRIGRPRPWIYCNPFWAKL